MPKSENKTNTSARTSETIMYSSLQQPPPLCGDGNLADNYRYWKRTFDWYLIASGRENTSDREKCALFLHVIGQVGRDIYEELDLAVEEELSCTSLCDKFSKRCDSQKNINFERHVFFETVQNNENFEKFLALLFGSPFPACMSLDAGRQSQRPYRYGMVLLCAGALINWLGLAEDYAEPVRYVGVACIVAGALLICAAMCCWLQSPARQPQNERASPDTHQIDDPIHVISMPDEETMQQKPPDYDTVAGAPPTYDDAIKLNPSRLLPTSSSARHDPAPTTRNSQLTEVAVIPGQPDHTSTPTSVTTIAPIHHSQVPKTPPPPYNPTHTIR